MADPNFASVLDRPADEIKRPPPIPMGTYLAVVDGVPTNREVGEEKVPAWEFKLKLIQPQPDVDPEELARSGGITNRSINNLLFERGIGRMTDEQAAWNFKRFLTEHLKIESEGKTMRQMMAEAPGRQVMVVIEHNPSQDGTEMFARVKATMAA